MTLVRLMTLRPESFARAVRISSCTPSVKNAFCLSSLRFSKGRTAMLFSGAVAAAVGAGVAAGAADVVVVAEAGARRQRYPPTTTAVTNIMEVATIHGLVRPESS